MIPVGITAAGWLLGKPLTPELLGTLGTLTWWALRSERVWKKGLADHTAAIRSIAQRQGVSTTRGDTVYALVEQQIEDEQRRPKTLPLGRLRP